MAGMNFIDDARQPLEAAMLHLSTVVRVCDSVNPENPPEWVSLLFPLVLDLESKVQSYMDAVHQHARPLLADMAKLTGGK